MADNKFFSSPSVDVIEKSTKIIGNIFSKDISGNISGNIEVNETLSLMSDSYVQGEIITGKLSVEEGAQVDATISMKSSKKLKALDTQQNNSTQSEKTA